MTPTLSLPSPLIDDVVREKRKSLTFASPSRGVNKVIFMNLLAVRNMLSMLMAPAYSGIISAGNYGKLSVWA